MADRTIENSATDIPAIPEILERVLLFALEEAKEKMTQGGDIVPFTALVVKENLFLETHPGDTADECFADARRTVEGARGANAYAFCYDGYVETDAGTADVVIAEGGIPGESEGMAIGYLYTMKGDLPVFEDAPAYIGEAPNFMADLKEADDYEEEEVEARYLEDEYEKSAVPADDAGPAAADAAPAGPAPAPAENA
ncbi:MAG: hypothetical protein FWG23_02840 [Eggerthellaceae bacterium]|nr:hypothetical protein [Eggerthellaceae bacterium]